MKAKNWRRKGPEARSCGAEGKSNERPIYSEYQNNTQGNTSKNQRGRIDYFALDLWSASPVNVSEMSRLTGIDRSTLNAWRLYGHAPRAATVEAVVRALGHKIRIEKAASA